MRALFDPRGVVVAGASSHPGKFGFVALHNILSQGYAGEVYATNRDGGTILGIETVASIDDLPAGAPVDLVFVCTPAAANAELLAAAPGADHRRIHHVGRLRRSRRSGSTPSSSWSRWPRSSACSSPARTARA